MSTKESGKTGQGWSSIIFHQQSSFLLGKFPPTQPTKKIEGFQSQPGESQFQSRLWESCKLDSKKLLAAALILLAKNQGYEIPVIRIQCGKVEFQAFKTSLKRKPYPQKCGLFRQYSSPQMQGTYVCPADHPKVMCVCN